jgi:hypothetical protein
MRFMSIEDAGTGTGTGTGSRNRDRKQEQGQGQEQGQKAVRRMRIERFFFNFWNT